jgi:hypothetical protein
MRTCLRGRNIVGVHDGAMHLLLDLDPSSDPVSGRVGPVGTVPRAFTGYASLIATLESIRMGETAELTAASEEPAR